MSEEDLSQVISKCPNKSCSLDILPTWLLKQHINMLLQVFARIVNMSLSTGVFPADLRTDIITPVFKKSLDKNELKNYRLVANLPFISKVIEKCAASQVVNHVYEHNLAEPLQSTYKALHSTETTLTCVRNDFLRAIDKQQAVFLFMLDLSAAFGTVDATILLQRLDCEFGIAGSVQQWFKTYLGQRSFRVSISGPYSENISLKYGLPQGPVVGPLGFVFYTYTVGRILLFL